MTSAVTAPMRAGGWNVILTIANQQYLGGIYQNPREPTVTFGDLCAELALCFDYPGGGKLLNNVDNVDNINSVNSVNTANTVNAASLIDSANRDSNQDQANINERPWFDIAFALTETPDEADSPVNHPSFITSERFDELVPGLASESATRRRTVTYHIVHHKACNISGSFKDHIRAKCVYSLPDPRRRHHPAFLPYNKSPADPRLNIMPLRRKAKARSQSPPKRSGSTSPNKADDAAGGPDNQSYDMIAPADMDIDIDAARKTISDFRMACIAQASCCAISGGGRPWSALQLIGPGVQACHIVPQQHYHLYPLGDPSDTTQDSARRLCQAWEKTWSPGNGILLMKHIHDFFDARLLSIHPTTLRIRVFVPFEDLELYHGRKAQIPPRVDRSALAHHYDMCCIENMAAERPNIILSSLDATNRSSSAISLVSPSSGGSTPLSGRPSLPMTPSSGDALQTAPPAGDPSKRRRPTRNGNETQGCVNDDDEYWSEEEVVQDLLRGRKRQRPDDFSFDGYVTQSNSREFLANVNRELQKDLRLA
ncbi:uncharacterized protein BBA_09908 [Beauveria bassiana ARSEF 2860]|uniref:HNH nuclease domain-containing protein n=1 Tax=Beauveria bassiana (strain ARSEF 2860) TaxID=655819 RepID=J5J2U1_BEAB2|nr:uncharacterized protein BBA_09908 [Beauveria bassiana ARSEF 2860]EJP61133.1 hypothetical protein BBA_09908 [Beauveria bassiana ARSEF 2860]